MGPCGPLRGPLMTMWHDPCHSPLNFGRMYSIWAPSVHQFRRAPLEPSGPHGGPVLSQFRALWWRCDVTYVTPRWILVAWMKFEPLRSISSDGLLWGPVGPFGARGPHRGPAGPFEALRPLRGPMRLLHRDPYCTSGALWAPLGPLRGPSGPCRPLRGPPITMGPSLYYSPSNFSPVGKISAPSVSRFGRDAQSNKQTNIQTNKHLNFELY